MRCILDHLCVEDVCLVCGTQGVAQPFPVYYSWESLTEVDNFDQELSIEKLLKINEGKDNDIRALKSEMQSLQRKIKDIQAQIETKKAAVQDFKAVQNLLQTENDKPTTGGLKDKENSTNKTRIGIIGKAELDAFKRLDPISKQVGLVMLRERISMAQAFARAEKSHYQELELASSFLIKAKTARLEELEELMRNVHRLNNELKEYKQHHSWFIVPRRKGKNITQINHEVDALMDELASKEELLLDANRSSNPSEQNVLYTMHFHQLRNKITKQMEEEYSHLQLPCQHQEDIYAQMIHDYAEKQKCRVEEMRRILQTKERQIQTLHQQLEDAPTLNGKEIIKLEGQLKQRLEEEEQTFLRALESMQRILQELDHLRAEKENLSSFNTPSTSNAQRR